MNKIKKSKRTLVDIALFNEFLQPKRAGDRNRIINLLKWSGEIGNRVAAGRAYLDYLKLDVDDRILFWNLLRTYKPRNALAHIHEANKIMKKIATRGHTFTTERKLKCTVKMLSASPNYKKQMHDGFVNALAKHEGSNRNDPEQAKVMSQIFFENLPDLCVFLYGQNGESFGYIVYIVKPHEKHSFRHARRFSGIKRKSEDAFWKFRLIKALEHAKKGEPPAPEHYMPEIIVGNELQSRPEAYAVVTRAVRLGTTIKASKLLASASDKRIGF